MAFLYRIMRYHLMAFLLLFIFKSSPLPAQDKEFMFDHFTVDDGLSYGIVNGMCKDKDGFMWIGTYNGLNRFDGTHFLVYKSDRNNLRALGNNCVHDICCDNDGNIWCATEGGVSRFNKSTKDFDNFQLIDDSIKTVLNQNAHNILCDRNGTIWCATSAGLYEFMPAQKLFRQHRHSDQDSTTLSSHIIYKHSMCADPDGDGLWIGTRSGINYFNTKTYKAMHWGNNPKHLAVFEDHRSVGVTLDKRKRLVYGDHTTHEITTWSIADNSMQRSKKILVENRNNFITDLANVFVDSRNNLWITTWAYLFYFVDGKTGEVSEVMHDEQNSKSINSNFCWEVLEDEQGTLWFGGLNGLSYFNPKKVNYRVLRPDLKFSSFKYFNFISSLFEDKKGRLWIGTPASGLLKYDEQSDSFSGYTFQKPAPEKWRIDNSVFSICEARDELWLGTNAGVWIFNPQTEKFRKFNRLPPEENADSMYVIAIGTETDHAIWFTDNDYKLFRYDINTDSLRVWHDKKNPDDIPFRYLSSISNDKKGNIWIGINEYGLLRYDAAKNDFIRYASDKNDTSVFGQGWFSDILEDHKGNIWVPVKGSGIGMINQETGKIKTWGERDGLAFNHSMAMAEDRFGKIWIAAYSQISIFDPQTENFENFYVDFAKRDYRYNNKMISLKNGKIASSMLGSILLFDPENYSVGLSLPIPLISSFSVFEKPVPYLQQKPEISLSYSENFFTIEYSAMTGADREKIKYAYKLEGFDKQWVQAGDRKLASYTNVPGGDYSFKVKSITADNKFSSAPATMQIHVSTIFYKSWWFRFVIACILFMVIRFYVRFRNKQNKQEQAEEAIAYFANSHYTNNSPEEILWDLARNCMSRLGFVDCVIYLADESKELLLQKAALGGKSTEESIISNPIIIPFGKGIVGSAAAKKMTELVKDTSADKRYIEDDATRLSEIAVPIIYDGEVIGVIDSEHPRRNFFTEDHKRILETIASICAVKIVNAKAAQELHEKETKLLEIDKAVAEMRLTALHAQMNPHFVFNCLNSIDHYILTNDIQNASRYLNKFAKLIRLILNLSDKMYIPIAKEIEMLQYYTELENLRLENKFHFNMAVDPELIEDETDIPAMLIQPFVENAILHGLINKEGERKLSITLTKKEDGVLCLIEDNGIGRTAAGLIKQAKTEVHESKGMRVTEDRINILSHEAGKKAMIQITDITDSKGEVQGTRVEIMIPVLADI